MSWRLPVVFSNLSHRPQGGPPAPRAVTGQPCSQGRGRKAAEKDEKKISSKNNPRLLLATQKSFRLVNLIPPLVDWRLLFFTLLVVHASRLIHSSYCTFPPSLPCGHWATLRSPPGPASPPWTELGSVHSVFWRRAHIIIWSTPGRRLTAWVFPFLFVWCLGGLRARGSLHIHPRRLGAQSSGLGPLEVPHN